jgi:hypothetical protein
MGIFLKVGGLVAAAAVCGYKFTDIAAERQQRLDHENSTFAVCIPTRLAGVLGDNGHVSFATQRSSATDYSASASFDTPENVHVSLEAFSAPGYGNKPGQAVIFSFNSKDLPSYSMIFLRDALPQDPSVDAGDTLILPIESEEAVDNPAKVNVAEFSNIAADCAAHPEAP